MENEKEQGAIEINCPYCKSRNIVSKGTKTFKRAGTYVNRYQCKDCGKWFGGEFHKIESKLPPPFVYQYRKIAPINWKLYNEIETNEKVTILSLLDELLNLVEIPKPNKTGRPSANMHDIVYSLLLKIYCRLSSRRLISELNIAKQSGYIKNVYSFNTVLKYLGDQRITLILQQLIKLSSDPLNKIEQSFSVDSTGFSTSRYASWFDYKYNKEGLKRLFLKAHVTIGNLTNVITAITITDQHGADITQFKNLIKKTAISFQIKDVCADKAYLSRENFDLVASVGGLPYIDFKSNARGNSYGELSHIWHKMFMLSKEKPQEFYSHYHLRSNVECTFNMIKQKFGTDLMGKTFESNANEILCKAVCHNLCCLISAYLEFNIDNSLCAQALEKTEIVKGA